MSMALYQPNPTATELRAAIARRQFREKIAARANFHACPAAPVTVEIRKEMHIEHDAAYFYFEKLRARLSVENIQRRVARIYGFKRDDLRSGCREAPIVRARHIAIWIARELLPHHSLLDLGRRFGRLDHTSVLFAIRKIQRLTEETAEFADEVNSIRAAIAAEFAPAGSEQA